MTTWVLLRGWAREARHWGEFPALLRARLPPGDALVAPDLPGSGSRHRESSPWRVQDMLRAVRAELQGMGAPPPYLPLALSLGGMVAMHWAHAHPAELAGCVLVNTSAGGMASPWQRLRPSSYAQLAWIARAAPAERERRILALTSNLRADDMGVAATWTAWARERGVSGANALRQLVAAAGYRAPLLAPRVPVLLVASKADRLVSPDCSAALAKAWNLPLRLHPLAGHDLPLDDPAWLAEQALDFASSVKIP